ncbi:membrane protein [Streptomyces albospinus]|uniref:Membrane protein n=1 Tax=Streptomyces albospinus TaxID=285515 RepID=A0ABQ2V197_9ACTN|nr:DUF4389 domain-containing protein [Streptomyces albospinus]GGU61166.1 membrane protein [Streptomyces albospinus]
MATLAAEYRPVRIEAELDEPLSRWLWAVKWLLLVPHHIALTVLAVPFLAASALAFVSMLFTGRYPRPLFRFTTGVLRWVWRVSFYSYGALATDRYPPFSLGEVPDYPTRLYIDGPPRMPRGWRLVASWLRALPEYLLVVLVALVFRLVWSLGGLSAFLLMVAVVTLVFTSPAGMLVWTGRYPRRQFRGLMTLYRWLAHVLAHFFFLTDALPPLRPEKSGRRLPFHRHHRASTGPRGGLGSSAAR